MTTLRVIDAPSNLGLRPPAPGREPGCSGAPAALRSAGFLAALDGTWSADDDAPRPVRVIDGGVVAAPPYDHAEWRREGGVRHAEQLATYARRLADAIGPAVDAGELPIVLGGDCSILLGSVLALRRRAAATEHARAGLVFVDGHSDFRHPGNTAVAGPVGAAAGEDLALVTGRGQDDLTDLDGLGPLVRDADVVVLGPRPDDDALGELAGLGIGVRTSAQILSDGPEASAAWAADRIGAPAGFWVHVDVDVLDPSVLPAVDSPDPGGLLPDDLAKVLAGLLRTGRCLGVEVTVFDPTQDPDGTQARLLVDVLAKAFAHGRATS